MARKGLLEVVGINVGNIRPCNGSVDTASYHVSRSLSLAITRKLGYALTCYQPTAKMLLSERPLWSDLVVGSAFHPRSFEPAQKTNQRIEAVSGWIGLLRYWRFAEKVLRAGITLLTSRVKAGLFFTLLFLFPTGPVFRQLFRSQAQGTMTATIMMMRAAMDQKKWSKRSSDRQGHELDCSGNKSYKHETAIRTWCIHRTKQCKKNCKPWRLRTS